MVVVIKGESVDGFELSDLFQVDSLLLEVVVVLEGHVSRVEVVVGGTVSLLEAGVCLVSTKSALHHSSEVNFGEDTVVGHEMVSEVGLEVVVVGETGGIGVT